MATWDEFAAASPRLAADGRQALERSGHGQAFLATVRGLNPPRINPVSLAIVDGRLLVFLIVGSAKLADLEADGRYALHAHQDPARPHEFQVRGHARPVDDPARRAEAAATWHFEVDDSYRLFEFSVEQAVYGERADPDDWPPRYTSWRA
jgi:dipeptidyl aminopeptidase/acylaminoacyl peptidase